MKKFIIYIIYFFMLKYLEKNKIRNIWKIIYLIIWNIYFLLICVFWICKKIENDIIFGYYILI